MNLKDAFRYQNVLTSWIDQTCGYLGYDQNVTKRTQEHMRTKANQDATDETIDLSKDREYPYEINSMVDFTLDLLKEKESISEAINAAKRITSIDIDSSVATNKKKQEVSRVLSRMANIKPSERVGRGQDYKFNNEGNQVSYYYETKDVTVIDFDRNKVKAIAKKLTKESDDISSQLDKIMIDTVVEFQPKYDVNDGLADVLEVFMS